MPRSLDDLLSQADELADMFEAYEPTPGDLTTVDPVTALRLAALRRAEAERELAHAVERARLGALPWAQIGEAIGTSGEAARQKYTVRGKTTRSRHLKRGSRKNAETPKARRSPPPTA